MWQRTGERFYCWVFEHDDQFKHSDDGISRHRWCQRCFTELRLAVQEVQEVEISRSPGEVMWQIRCVQSDRWHTWPRFARTIGGWGVHVGDVHISIRFYPWINDYGMD